MGKGASSPLEKVQLRASPESTRRPLGGSQSQGPVDEESQEREQNNQTRQEWDEIAGRPVGGRLDLVHLLQSEIPQWKSHAPTTSRG